jgi:hypothetical protein
MNGKSFQDARAYRAGDGCQSDLKKRVEDAALVESSSCQSSSLTVVALVRPRFEGLRRP